MGAGIILLDKSEQMSSASAIARVKKTLPQVKKIGHAGTLDPMATGLLICAVNGATRLARFAEAGEKVYSGKIRFGITSETNDIWGKNCVSTGKRLPSLAEVLESSAALEGEIDQTPPQVSAVKVAGKRAYKRARAGEEFALEARRVSLRELSFCAVSEDEVFFRLRCSKGFYVRSFARDLGERFGCGAVLSELRRETSFPFSVNDAVSLENLSVEHILPWDCLFPVVPRLALDQREVSYLKNGNVRLLESLDPKLVDVRLGQLKNDRVICTAEKGGAALGLLIRNSEDKWQIAVNLSN